MTTATSRYFALLALTAALWGAQPLLVKITMRELNPSTMTAVRYLLMSITFFALMRWRGLPLLPPLRLMPALLLMGITGVALNNIPSSPVCSSPRSAMPLSSPPPLRP